MLGPNTAPSSSFHPYKLLRSRRTWVCPLALLLGLGWPWGAARAEGGGDAYKPDSFSGLSLEELLDVKVATVVTASKHEQKATEAPATVIVITRSDIRLRGYRFLTDVLRDLPGMETIETYFSEFGTLVPVRGVAGNNKIVVLLNGVRVNPPGGESMMFRSDFSLLEAEQIEIIYGPGSTLYGQDAISAVINVITRKPDDTLLDATGAAGVPLRGEGAVSLHHKVGSGSVLAALSYENARLSDLTSQYPDEWPGTTRWPRPKGPARCQSGGTGGSTCSSGQRSPTARCSSGSASPAAAARRGCRTHLPRCQAPCGATRRPWPRPTTCCT